MNSSKLSHFLPCDPISEFFEEDVSPYGPTTEFCAEWNPDFLFNGRQCCSNLPHRQRKKLARKAFPKKRTGNHCDDRTETQKLYEADFLEHRHGDMLTLLTREIRNYTEQAFCTVNNGFLAFGRPILATPENRLHLKSAERCLNYGTDLMAGMLEWVGREVGKKYDEEPAFSKVRLVIGNVSGPRGGMLMGRSGLIGHLSHTSGQDADIGFLTAHANKESPTHFHTQFESTSNWWLLKQIFTNPFACVKVVFLDRRHIRSLEKLNRKDPEWKTYRRYIRHVPGHKHHFHVRIGDSAGEPGCTPNSQPDLELEEDIKLASPAGEPGEVEADETLKIESPAIKESKDESKTEATPVYGPELPPNLLSGPNAAASNKESLQQTPPPDRTS